jgi:hypothetical protein
MSAGNALLPPGWSLQAMCVHLLASAGRHVTSVPLQRGTEVLAFNPRYSKLMAVAEPVANVPSSRSKERSPVPCYVSLVQLK